MSYNALDVASVVRQARDQLILEQQDLMDCLIYDHATSSCSNCPYLDEPMGWVPEVCCKESGEWDEQYQSSHDHLKTLAATIDALNVYLKATENAHGPDDEPPPANPPAGS